MDACDLFFAQASKNPIRSAAESISFVNPFSQTDSDLSLDARLIFPAL